MTQCRLEPAADDIPCRCDDCGEELLSGQLDMITDIQERLNPGALVPVGQCPNCHALAYYAEGYAPDWTVQAIGERLFEQRAVASVALQKAESFVSGFEDDPMQEGIAELLAAIRGAIAGAPADPVQNDALALLKEALAAWPQLGTDEEMNGGDMVEWFGGFAERAAALIAKSEGKS